MARKEIFQRLFRDAGKLTLAEMYETSDLLGKGAGLKEVFSRADVPPRVKQAMRTLLLCMSNVVGSNAHRTVLRHVNNSYKLLFGPPLVFVTPNVADVKSPVMWLLYRGEQVGSWRLLEQDAPEMPAVREMLRIVARDPVSQAVFFDLMIKLFLRHVLRVDLQTSWADGVVSSGQPGVCGCVQAYFGPVE